MWKTTKNTVETKLKTNKKVICIFIIIFISQHEMNLSSIFYYFLLKSFHQQLTGLLTTCEKPKKNRKSVFLARLFYRKSVFL